MRKDKISFSDLKNKTLLYFDNFKDGTTGSRLLNLNLFKHYYKQVYPIQVRWINPIQMKFLIWKYKPDQIHYGESTKSEKLITLSTYKMVQKNYPNIFQTVLYGDLYMSSFIINRAQFVNASTIGHIIKDRPENCFWYPLTLHTSLLDSHYSKEVPWEEKKYDIVFIGANRDKSRQDILMHLHSNNINVHVWGSGWESFPFSNHPQCSIQDSFKIYKQSKLVLNEIYTDYCSHNGFNRCTKNYHQNYSNWCQNSKCPGFESTVSYTSNRLLIAAYAKAGVITYHNKGLERILTPNKSCVVTTRTTIIDTIKTLLNDKDRVTEIGNNAHNEIKRFSFENLMLKYWEVGSNS